MHFPVPLSRFCPVKQAAFLLQTLNLSCTKNRPLETYYGKLRFECWASALCAKAIGEVGEVGELGALGDLLSCKQALTLSEATSKPSKNIGMRFHFHPSITLSQCRR